MEDLKLFVQIITVLIGACVAYVLFKLLGFFLSLMNICIGAC